MKPRLHLLTSDTPLPEYSSAVALCGEELERVSFTTPEGDLRFVEVRSVANCKKCLKVEVEQRKYNYCGYQERERR